MASLSNMAGDFPEPTFWRARIAYGALSKSLEEASEDFSSRLWISEKPAGWSRRDYARAVQLERAISRRKSFHLCRFVNGCNVDESIAHVLQTCPLTHG